MPILEITFTGACVFVREDKNGPVEVLFLNDPTGEHADPVHLHVPILVSSRGVVVATNEDGEGSEGRTSGVPIYLANYGRSQLLLDEAPTNGPVSVVNNGQGKDKPTTNAGWKDMGFCLHLKDLAPNGKFDVNAARAKSRHIMTLSGGELIGVMPSQQLGDNPWTWNVGTAVAPQEVKKFVTDLIRYRFMFDEGQHVSLLLTQNLALGSDREVWFKDGDVRVTVAHEPFLMTLGLTTGAHNHGDTVPPGPPPPPGDGTERLEHVGMMVGAFTGQALSTLAVPSQKPLATPDPTYCPPAGFFDEKEGS